MIDFLKHFVDNYTILQIVYSTLPYFVGVVIVVLYSKFYLKNSKYSLFALPLVAQGIASSKLYLFSYQLNLPLQDYSSLYFVTLPFLLTSLLTVILMSKITLVVKSKKGIVNETAKDVQNLHILTIVFALVLEGITQYSQLNLYAYTLSLTPTLLSVLISYLLFRKISLKK